LNKNFVFCIWDSLGSKWRYNNNVTFSNWNASEKLFLRHLSARCNVKILPSVR